MRRFLLLGVVAVAGACSSGESAPDAAPARVSIDTFRFDPSPLRVPVGTTVTFANGDAVLHTATADDGRFDLQLPDKGTSATYTFGEAGTFHYRCTRHPGMEGDIEVIRG